MHRIMVIEKETLPMGSVSGRIQDYFKVESE